MKLLNMRRGFATNSSSSHSILEGVGADGRGDFEGWPASYKGDNAYFFGHQWGTLGTEESKRRYLAATVYCNFLRAYGGGADQYRLAAEFAKSVDPRFLSDADFFDGYVDHDSLIDVARDWADPNRPDAGFLAALQRFFERPDVVVTLGNDDDEEGCNGPAEGLGTPVGGQLIYEGRGDVVAREEAPGIWTLFSRRYGDRFTFAVDDDATLPERLKAPHLADVKITGFCPFGCPFCYQGSTPDGRHAMTTDIIVFADQASEMRIFEVAIGGGEPTMHPDFVNILRVFRNRGIVPNFTTYTIDWWNERDRDRAMEIVDLCGSFGFSVASEEQVDALASADRSIRSKAVAHIVMGVAPWEDTLRLIKAIGRHNLDVTLLGYKPLGRGASYHPHDYAGWLDALLALDYKDRPCRVGIDTTLAATSRDQLTEFPEWLYHTTEGASSMYVDLVDGKTGPSSYHRERLIPYENSLRDAWWRLETVQGDEA